jgi:hypothetical protein
MLVRRNVVGISSTAFAFALGVGVIGCFVDQRGLGLAAYGAGVSLDTVNSVCCGLCYYAVIPLMRLSTASTASAMLDVAVCVIFLPLRPDVLVGSLIFGVRCAALALAILVAMLVRRLVGGVGRTALALAVNVIVLVRRNVVWVGYTALALAVYVAMLVRLVVRICSAAGAFAVHVAVLV